jgi:hypothetical protein
MPTKAIDIDEGVEREEEVLEGRILYTLQAKNALTMIFKVGGRAPY